MSLGFVLLGVAAVALGLLLNRSLFAALVTAVVARATLEVVTKDTLFNVHVLATTALLGRTAAKEDTLSPLPGFNTEEEEEGLDEDDGPLPADGCVLEDNVVETGNVDQREHGDETSNDGPEEERVAPNVVHPLSEVALAARLHAEERTTHVDHLPGEEEGEPGKAGKGGSTSAENNLATLTAFVASFANVGLTISKAVQDKNERSKAKGSHPQTVDHHVDHEFGSKDTLLEL